MTTPGRYQTTMFADLDPDVALEPFVVLIDDPRWATALDELRTAEWVAIDTEFYSKDSGPWKRKEINYWHSDVRLIQVGLPSGLALVFNLGGLLDDRAACIARHATAIDQLRTVIENPAVPKVGMTLLTEYLLLRIHFGMQMRCMRDVMLMSQVIWAGVGSKAGRWTESGFVASAVLKHNLASICERLGIAVDKTEQLSDWAGRLQNKQLNYAARDVIVPRPVWVALSKRARTDGILKSVQAECAAQPAFCECEFNGLPLDLQLARADLIQWEKVRDTFFAPFRELFPGVNPSSPAQVAEALSNALDVYACPGCKAEYDPLLAEPVGTPLPKTWECGCVQVGLMKPSPPERTKRRGFFELKMIRGKLQQQPVTSDEALVLYKDVWYVHSLLEGRSTSACMNWLKAAIENAFDAGNGMRIRADFRQIAGGYTEHGSVAGEAGRGMGRSSASRPINTQNPSNLQPAHEKAGAVSVRRCIRPLPGRAFIVADLSQAHARIAAQWSQDPVMLKAFRNGEDFHLAITHRLLVKKGFNITIDEAVKIAADKMHPLHKEFKARRQGCKSTNYAELNMSGVKTLQSQMATMPVPVILDDDEVGDLIVTWRQLYAVIYQKQKQHIKKVNSYRHYFKDIGVDGEYGESRALTGRRLFLIKEYKPPRERYDGTMSEGYWSVKATDAVSSIWMMTEADLIKRAMGQLVSIFNAHSEWDVRWANMAHDEIDLDCAAKHALEVATVVQHEFDEAMRWAGIVDLPVNEPNALPSTLIKADWSAK